ncbi:histidine phosphatase family protein [Burkholderia sp. SRS-W-2-2016]|uniref:histidine phosphatase family protein n=1 Tax=Burkholderia sp. SRS-W-2-2016 TaxID=1926878 RepID=UPI00094AE4BE|nr:histidine phosphatase family protein [Burkholderia sp. SRS-W-2-2016]OLL27909.1 histidine phosphatase family protein [Burkholderia sp. SRS-W-2-2016]
MDTRLLLVSHAATVAQRAGRFPADEPLEARDRAAAEAARAVLARRADLGGATAFTSPAACARDTVAALGLTATPVDALADVDYGEWRGQRLADIAQQAADALAAWTRDPAAAPPGGESFIQLVQRIGQWLDALGRHAEPKAAPEAEPESAPTAHAVLRPSTHHAAQSARTVIAVTHAPLMRAAIVYALGAAPEVFPRIEIAPLSVIELRSSRRGWTWWPATAL